MAETRRTLASLIVIGTLGYALAFFGEPFVFILFLPVILLTIIFLLIRGFRKIPRLPRILIGCTLFLLGGTLVMNRYFLTDKFPKPSTNPRAPSVAALASLPYLTWTPTKETAISGVTRHDRTRSFEGINIYTPRNLSEAYLMDMAGNTLHKWSAERSDEDGLWQLVKIDRSGDLFVLVKGRRLVRLDWDSNILWTRKGRFHHDMAIAENQDVYILGRKEEIVFRFGLPVPILNDHIIVFSSTENMRREVSLFPILKEDVSFRRLLRIYRHLFKPRNIWKIIKKKVRGRFLFKRRSCFDVLHTNTLEIISRDIPGVCKEGDILVSSKFLNLIAIIDFESLRVRWKWGPGVLSNQHHPTILENGNVLIFDNGVSEGRSRILELEPRSKEIIWEYQSNPPEGFFSLSRGSNQRLPNGNTLITESDRGRIFEVTRDGEIVWDFYNPEVLEHEKKRAAIYRMMRIIDPEMIARLKDLG